MIADLNDALQDPFAGSNYDVCICGAGVAGITLALKLSKRLNVLLLEGGGFDYSSESQSVYQGENVGDDYVDPSIGRLRFLGGASNHWGGDCRPLDSYDFQPKAYLPDSGWPIQASDLKPYLKPAETMLELSHDDPWVEPSGPLQERLDASPSFQSINFKVSPPTRFGTRYRSELEQRSNISCYLNASVLDLQLSEDPSSLDHFRVRNYAGKEFQARARIFVLATGGIENPRLLLNSDRQVPGGVGNQNQLVGRYFMDHLFCDPAEFIFEDAFSEYVDSNPFGDSFKGRLRQHICENQWIRDVIDDLRERDIDCLSSVRNFFSPSLELLEAERVLNFNVRMRVRTPGHGELTDGRIIMSSEQAPNPLSRIMLGDDLDQFGMRRVKLDWKVSALDIETIRRGIIRFGEAFARLELGRIKMTDWLLTDEIAARVRPVHHHMGTTRMGESPREGVVDSTQKVFGTKNLYVAGSSVFTTGGHANPTLTIVQMTLRLADHINSVV